MTILEAVASYSGRINRTDYWLKGVLPTAIISVVLGTPFLLHVLSRGDSMMKGGSAAVLLALPCAALLWFRLPADVKRLHDRNHSAWYLLISLIPIVGPLWLFVEMGFFRGSPSENRYGASQCGPSDNSPCAPAVLPSERMASALAVMNVILFLAALFAAGVLPVFANAFVDYYGPKGGPLSPLLCSLAATITHRYGLFFAPLYGYIVWINVRLVYTRRHRWALWTLFLVFLLCHAFLAVSYVPAYKTYLEFSQKSGQQVKP